MAMVYLITILGFWIKHDYGYKFTVIYKIKSISSIGHSCVSLSYLYSFLRFWSSFRSSGEGAHLGVISGEVINQVSGWLIHRIDLWNVSECLCIAFSHHDFGTLLNELHAILELEADGAFISRTHAWAVLILHLDRLNGWSDATNVQNTLVAVLYCSVVVKNSDLSIKVLHA